MIAASTAAWFTAALAKRTSTVATTTLSVEESYEVIMKEKSPALY